jgi:lipopolysaccharide transport system permease protein
MDETMVDSPLEAQVSGIGAEPLPVRVVEPDNGVKTIDLGELWEFRELVYFLTWRDIKVRYKQSLLGAAWALIQPIMYAVVFTIVFAGMAKVPSNGIPYPLFSFAALLPWTFFSTALNQAGNSVVSSGDLITKVYFPRIAVPIAAVGAALFDFLVGSLVLLAMIIWYMCRPVTGAATIEFHASLLIAPVVLLFIALAALGVGALLAALNVAYRDFKYTIPFLVQLWMFATPAIYMGSSHEPLTGPSAPTASPAANVAAVRAGAETTVAVASIGLPTGQSEGAVSDRVQNLLSLNPLTGLIGTFRSAILGQPIEWGHLAFSCGAATAMFLFGCLYFHRVENNFADII